MGEPLFLRDYAVVLKKIGDRRFHQRYDYPVLVCVGLVGEVKDKPGWRRRTLPMEGVQEFVPMQSILHRVWPIVSKAGRRLVDQIVVGQDPMSDVVVAEYTVSRQHCAFNADRNKPLAIMDLGSLNGTQLNGMRLSVKSWERVNNGTTLCMGRMKFECFTTSGLIVRLGHV